MQFSSQLSLVITACITAGWAQTFPGFEPVASKPLVVVWHGTALNYSEQSVPISTVSGSDVPTIGLTSLADCNNTYLLVMVDPDAIPGNIETRDGLHTIQGNFTCNASSTRSAGNTTFYELRSPSNPLAPFVPPVPQPKSPPTIHRYTLLLFPQPMPFMIPSQFLSALPLNPANVTNRLGFNIDGFAQSIGQAPFAGNVFKVKSPDASSGNNTAASPASSQSSTGTGGLIASSTVTTPKPSSGPGAQSLAQTSFGTTTLGLLGGLLVWLL